MPEIEAKRLYIAELHRRGVQLQDRRGVQLRDGSSVNWGLLMLMAVIVSFACSAWAFVRYQEHQQQQQQQQFELVAQAALNFFNLFAGQ